MLAVVDSSARHRCFVSHLPLVSLVSLLALTDAGCAGRGQAGSTTGYETSAAPSEGANFGDSERVLTRAASLSLSLPDPAFYREADDGWSVRLRVRNEGDHALRLDLAAPTLVHPNQFGAQTDAERLLVDERRLTDAPPSEEELAALRHAAAEGDLYELRAGDALDLSVPFHGTGAMLFAGFATPYMYVSLDGFLDALHPDGSVERLSLAWGEGSSGSDTDLVMPMPVMLAERACRARRVSPRAGSDAWPVRVCRP